MERGVYIMEETPKDEDLKAKALRYSLIAVVVLIALIIAISCYRRYTTIVLDNEVSDPRNTQEKIVFNDIKIKINNDVFSYDQIRNEVNEKDLVSYYSKNLHKGDTIIYVSQDTGVQQLLMAKLISQSGRVYVLNPFEKYNDTIELSAEANGFKNRVFTKTFAISNDSFDGFLVYKNSESPGYGEIRTSDYSIEKGYNALKVTVTTLDNLFPNLQNINFLRITTKNNAVKTIAGAWKIIKHSPKIKIILDYEKDIGQDLAAMNSLKEEGFKIYLIDENGEISPADFEKITKGHILLQRD